MGAEVGLALFLGHLFQFFHDDTSLSDEHRCVSTHRVVSELSQVDVQDLFCRQQKGEPGLFVRSGQIMGERELQNRLQVGQIVLHPSGFLIVLYEQRMNGSGAV